MVALIDANKLRSLQERCFSIFAKLIEADVAATFDRLIICADQILQILKKTEQNKIVSLWTEMFA
jgi:hypothetical protein